MLDETEGKDIGTFLHTVLEDAFGVYEGKKPVLDENFFNNLI